MLDFEGELGRAVRHFWQVRGSRKSAKAANLERRMPVNEAQLPVENMPMDL